MCRTYPLNTATCGKRFRVNSDLAFGWAGGRLTVTQSGTAAAKKNPARECGFPKDQVIAFEQFRFPYPFLAKQRATLSATTIFGSRRNLRLVLNSHELGIVDGPTGFTSFTERTAGGSTVTLQRISSG